MSHLLWKYYWENDVDKFRRLLASAGPNSYAGPKSPAISTGGVNLGAAPGNLGTSPRMGTKSRKSVGYSPAQGKPRDSIPNLTKSDVNSRDHAGLTLLLRAASLVNPSAILFVQALIDHPSIDIYVQDPESGWNALHRSLYTGNISIARALLAKERADLTSHTAGSVNRVGLLIKTKDHEGNSPFDLYNSTIAARSLRQREDEVANDDGSDSGDAIADFTQASMRLTQMDKALLHGDELFVFGSNKNSSLGVGDEDDRQYPERVQLQRPAQLLHRFYEEFLQKHGIEPPVGFSDLDGISTLVRNEPLIIQDVMMSKLHSAILTNDPVSNLYVSGIGRGGRLGLGDENTRFKFLPLQGPLADKRVHRVALGQNHSMAIAGNGELWTWGLNSDSQLGYVLPPPIRADEEPMSLIPRQVFGALKKEVVLGIAASSIHSVAHTGSSLYCWGRNVGQLALMDADSRSLDVQQTPRKVAVSLISAPIEMVSAIDKATSCLLSNHTVWIFTNYGYNLVKFPLPDVLVGHNLVASRSFPTRYDSLRRDVCYITSGGETIALLTKRGDLFTIQLKGDSSVPAGSTTNPVKIKGAITQPRCIWRSRKDGVASVSVGEHGSVIICTESGAVWKRVKRNNSKLIGASDKRKDFKFQRIPYITDCVAVRSSTFGAYAAIRKDSKVMTEEISISSQTLWDDLGSLLCLRDFEPSVSVMADGPSSVARDKAITRETPGSVAHRILSCVDIETELRQWLQFASSQYDVDMEIRTSSAPDIRIPVHGWLLAGRSPVLRDALSKLHCQDPSVSNETFMLENAENKTVLTLLQVDIYTMLNVVLFAYHDAIIPVWKYTRQALSMAHRFRQVRSELMRVATNLNLPKLEAAARLQATLDRSLDQDLRAAIEDPLFFEDGDTILELDGGEIVAHSQLLCQRCPFFEGMFFGRSQGQWLADRRDEAQHADRVRIDLKHIRPEVFSYVISFLYADVGAEMFDEVTMATLDEFSELVIEVLSVANELMLDRLSQICQSIIGKFVTTRNIANLLNEISPCAVSEFKSAGLEYICLQLESMLENHLLDGLDDELLLDLDEKVRDNQLACLPFSKSGRAELLLHEKYPALLLDIEEERQTRVKEMANRHTQREEEKKLSTTPKLRFGSLGDPRRFPQTPQRGQRPPQPNPIMSPILRSKSSVGDMIFDMEEEAQSKAGSPRSPPLELPEPLTTLGPAQVSRLPEAWKNSKGKAKADEATSLNPSSPAQPLVANLSQVSLTPNQEVNKISDLREAKSRSPWASSTHQTTKLDMKNIISEASSKSTLTAALAAQATKDGGVKPQTKLSQKERKRQMQMQLGKEAQAANREEQAKAVPWEMVSAGKKQPVWKMAEPVPKASLQETISAEEAQWNAVSARAKPLVASESNPQAAQRRTASPDTRFPGQGRSRASPAPAATASSTKQQEQVLVPHSKQYMVPAPRAETWLGASLIDIIGQQRREREQVQEAVAKRSLQEIQQEQAFQEWWDQESRRTQEEEAKRLTKANKAKEERGGGGSRRRRGNRGDKTRGTESSSAKQVPGEGSKAASGMAANDGSRG